MIPYSPLMSSEMRLQKFLSAAGIASRRKAEVFITGGRVTVNGEACTVLGTKVTPGKDTVTFDGAIIRLPKQPHYVLLNKPPATVCTEHDPEGRDRVHDLLPAGLPRLFTVGRLDYDTEGVLLFTTDGELANALTDPANAVPRTYEVKIQGEPDEHLLRRFNEGIRLDDGRRTRPSPTELVKRTKTNAWYEVVLTEGRNRQIHRMTMACGRRVLKIRRIMYGPIQLGTLRPGKTRPLTDHEIKGLVAAGGLARKRRADQFRPGHDPAKKRAQKSASKSAQKKGQKNIPKGRKKTSNER